MGAIEWTKDMLGIMDDVGDFAVKTAKVLRRVDPLINKLEQAGKKLGDKLDAAEKEGDLKKVKRLLDNADFNRPRLIGKTVSKKLNDALGDIRALKGKMKKLDPSVRAKALALVEGAEDDLLRAMRDNAELIGEISDAQRDVKARSRRTAALITGGTLTLAAAGVGSIVYGNVLRSFLTGMLFRGGQNYLSQAGTRLAQAGEETVRTRAAAQLEMERQQENRERDAEAARNTRQRQLQEQYPDHLVAPMPNGRPGFSVTRRD